MKKLLATILVVAEAILILLVTKRKPKLQEVRVEHNL